jgi:hypothetical protein
MSQHRQRLELTLDMFTGCAHSCAGCMVNKENAGNLEDMVDLLVLTKSLVAHGYIPFDIAMGPTDIMSSSNVDEVLNDPRVQELIDIFNAFTLNAAFLEKKESEFLEMCKRIDRHAPGKPVRFLIPAAPAMFKSKKFGESIARKLEFVKTSLTSAWVHEAGFVVNCTAETLVEDFDVYLRQGFDIEFPVPKDDILNIPYGRAANKDILLAGNVLNVSQRISRFYETLEGDDERSQNPDKDYNSGTMLNLLYMAGVLYWVPFLKDEFAFIHGKFEIQRPWTMENVLKARTDANDESLSYLNGTACMTCDYLSSCLEKGISRMMEALSIRECLTGV